MRIYRPFSNPHEPPDHPLFRGRLRWTGNRDRSWSLSLSRNLGLWRFHGLRNVVAHFVRLYRSVTEAAQSEEIAVAEQNLRFDHFRLWLICAAGFVLRLW